jgi:WD40 repeat protein
MPDVFISYSRKDKEFVRRLHDALKASKRDIWIDWEDIPLTADWWKEIQEGIEAADNFIFTISPDSARSTVCRQEADHAVANGKRFVPILYRDVTDPEDQKLLHPHINSHNWIFFKDEKQFDEQFKLLLGALDADLEHSKTHTRLLVRAKQWDANGRDNSFLLKGTELAEAETWLTQAGSKRPAVLPLHNEYIFASREAANRRQRMLLIGVSVALLVALALAGLSFLLFQDSQRNLSLAEVRGTQVAHQAATSDANAVIAQQNAATATIAQGEAQFQAATAVAAGSTAVHLGDVNQSVALGSQAQVQMDSLAPERSVLLGLEALKHYPYTVQAERGLGMAVMNARLQQIITSSSGGIYTAEFSPDVIEVAVGGENKLVEIWSDEGLEQRFTGHTDVVNQVAWSLDGSRLASASDDGTTIVWDTKAGKALLTLGTPVNDNSVKWVAWSPDGKRIGTAHGDGSARLWDAASGKVALTLRQGGDGTELTRIEWSPDGDRIALAGSKKFAAIFDAKTGAEVLKLEQEGVQFYSIAWSPDGSKVVTTSDDDSDTAAWVWDTETGEVLFAFANGHTRRLFDARWSPSGRRVMTASSDNTVRIWDADTAKELFILAGHTGEVYSATFAPEEVLLLTASFDGTAKIWDANRVGEIINFVGHSDRVYSAAFSPDAKRLVTASYDKTAKIWDTEYSEDLLTLEGHTDRLRDAAWSPDGKRVATASIDTTAKIWDAASGKALLTLSGHQGWVYSVDWSPDGQRLVTASADRKVIVWDATTGKAVLTLTGHTGPVRAAAWSPDGKRIATASADFTAKVWDAATGKELLTFGQHRDWVYAVAWSPDGTRIASASADSTARIWDANTGQEYQVLNGHRSVVGGVTWSPNGKRLLTASDDKTAKIWQADSGDELLTITGHTNAVRSVEWSKDGRQILTGSLDGTAEIWVAWQTTQELLDYAEDCCMVRQLTRIERQQFNLPPSP